MANNAPGPVDIGFTYANRVPASGNSGSFLSNGANYLSIVAMRTRLAAFDATTYTSEVLESMTTNDMVFALRSIDDPGTISNYHPTQASRTA